MDNEYNPTNQHPAIVHQRESVTLEYEKNDNTQNSTRAMLKNMGPNFTVWNSHLPPNPQQISWSRVNTQPRIIQQSHNKPRYTQPPTPPSSGTFQSLSQPRHAVSPRIQTGPSNAAMAYQLSQQMPHYQVPGAVSDPSINGNFMYHPPSNYYDPYGHPYTINPHHQNNIGFQHTMSFQENYSTRLHPNSPQRWYPSVIPRAPYYPIQQTDATYPIHFPQNAQQYPGHTLASRPRRHSVPVSRYAKSPENSSRKSWDIVGVDGTGPKIPEINSSIQSVQKAMYLTSFLPRGPPRKPKQSGYALWVGNLPPETIVNELKDHFSRGAKEDIQSVFLISKSNCAFVNYRTEDACNQAKDRFHDSRFRNVKLVCRLRRGSTPAVGLPLSAEASGDEEVAVIELSEKGENLADPRVSATTVLGPRSRTKNKYFIVKSLTVEDLELSVGNGTWATQRHNEAVLNEAFQEADNVYLIFSANKSGEYYGYARMESRIAEDSSVSRARILQGITVTYHPKSTFTMETETAPRGRIIDDSSRGTIFWEALSEAENTPEIKHAEETNTWGIPFTIKWISTTRVPFYRTRGLRNQLNSNREVKIARDGTELDETVGQRLIHMFQRNLNI